MKTGELALASKVGFDTYFLMYLFLASDFVLKQLPNTELELLYRVQNAVLPWPKQISLESIDWLSDIVIVYSYNKLTRTKDRERPRSKQLYLLAQLAPPKDEAFLIE